MQPEDVEPAIERAARAGDRQAFAALVERHWGPVFRWLMGLTHNSHLAEDLTQEAFLRAWRALASFQEGASFRVWLFSIARHCLIDRQRGPRGAATVRLSERLTAAAPDPADLAEDREGTALFQQACARLPDYLQAAFLLWAQHDLAFAEVAAVLGITEATARWRVFKARLTLMRELGHYLDRKPR